MPAHPRWISIFADTPAAGLDAATTFWTGVTATRPGEPAGEHGEYLPLQPADGERHVWLQRSDAGPASWHPDLHVGDLSAAALEATGAGATVVRATAELVVLTSPGGLPFCLFADDRPAHRAPEPVRHSDGHTSRLDQLCLDIPASTYDTECAFWAGLTGWAQHPGSLPEFAHLERPRDVAVRLLLQRTGDTGPVRAHADLATDDRTAETAVHVAAGASVEVVHDGWTTLLAPGGHRYCITDRTP